ncbi:MAG TPA: MFS transporter [Candidatus Eisenbacteria bacterium]|nr:MFS transporter [Candidatus Eisenbacteria bacterium]
MPFFLLTAAFLEGFAVTLIQGFLPLYLRQSLGERSFAVLSLVLAIPALGTAVASNFWGGLSDVTGRMKPIILVGAAGYVIALLGIPAVRHGLGVVAWIGLASLLYGTLAPTAKAYATLVLPERREQGITYVLLAYSSGWLAGSFGGGGLVEGGLGPGLRAAMWTCAGLTGLNALLASRFLPDMHRPRAPAPERRGWAAGVAADLAALYGNPRLFQLCVIAFFCVAGNYLMWGFFTVFLVERLHASLHVVRYALAISSVLGVAGLPFIPPLVRRFGGARMLAVGITLYLLMYSAMGVTRDPIVAAILYAAPLYGLVHVSANTLAAEVASVSQRGGGLGVLQGAYSIATIVGPLTGGLIADRKGLASIPWVAFAFILAACPLAWLATRRNAR